MELGNILKDSITSQILELKTKEQTSTNKLKIQKLQQKFQILGFNKSTKDD